MKYVTLGEVVDVLDNQRIPVNSIDRAKRIGRVPYYGATGQVGTIDKALFNETLILLGEDGAPFFDPTKHKAYEISGPAWVNNHAHVLRAKSEYLIQRFLLHFLNSFNYFGYVNGSTRLKLTQGDMRRIPIPLPHLEKQHEIVERLDGTFAEIALLEGNLDVMDSLLNECDSAILYEILTTSDSRLDSHRIAMLGEVTELISRGISPAYSEFADTFVLNQRCIREGSVNTDFARRHDEQKRKVQDVKLLKNGDGLINSTGVGTLGRTALFKDVSDRRFTVDSHVTIVRPISKVLRSDYFGLVLKALEELFESLSTGTSGQTELPRDAIKDTVIRFPRNLADQEQFYNYYNSLSGCVKEGRRSIVKRRVLASALRQSLLSSAFIPEKVVA